VWLVLLAGEPREVSMLIALVIWIFLWGFVFGLLLALLIHQHLTSQGLLPVVGFQKQPLKTLVQQKKEA
jgi:RsiW-degrading membrane proteinase PrsW (M82 family)